jgi:hypothetical protein
MLEWILLAFKVVGLVGAFTGLSGETTTNDRS